MIAIAKLYNVEAIPALTFILDENWGYHCQKLKGPELEFKKYSEL